MVYDLTDFGRELEQPIMRLGFWGAKAMGPMNADDHFSIDSLALALRGSFHPEHADKRPRLYEFKVEGQSLRALVADGKVVVPSDSTDEPDLTVDAEADVLAAVLSGALSLEGARKTGRLQGAARSPRPRACSLSSASRRSPNRRRLRVRETQHPAVDVDVHADRVGPTPRVVIGVVVERQSTSGAPQSWSPSIGSMLPAGLTTSSSSPWNAQIGTSPSAHPAVSTRDGLHRRLEPRPPPACRRTGRDTPMSRTRHS